MICAFANYKKHNSIMYTVLRQLRHSPWDSSDRQFVPFDRSAKSFLNEIRKTTKFAHDRIVEQYKKTAECSNRARNPHTFSVNEKAWLSTKNLFIADCVTMRRLYPKFCGPLRITEKINDVSFRLRLPESMKAQKILDLFHGSLSKTFVLDMCGQ